MNLIVNWIKKRTIGFWLVLAAAVLSVIEAVVYMNVIKDVRYFSDLSFYLALFAFVPFLLLAVFSVTEKYAPAALALMVFLSLLAFFRPQTGLFGDIIFGAELSIGYFVTVILMCVNIGLGIAGIFMKQSKEDSQVLVKNIKETV